MDNELRDVAFMWREFNDEYYRIQTNSEYVIRKLTRRMKTNKVQICGKTIKGSKEHWVIFRVRYKKPSTAKQSFIRLTNCGNDFTDQNGTLKAVVVHKLAQNNGGEV